MPRSITEMPINVPPLPRAQSSDERRAAALAEVSQMRDDLVMSNEEIERLKYDVQHLETQLALTMEDRNKYRVEALSVRAKLIELATSMANISLQCRSAEGIVMAVHELTQNGATPSDEALDRLEQELNAMQHTEQQNVRT